MKQETNGHLRVLENEAVHVMREVAAQFERPVILFSGGKDSIVLTWLARKAFHPGPIPFPLLHIDTGHNFPETREFRDRFAKELGCRLIVRYVQDSIDRGRVKEEEGPEASRNGRRPGRARRDEEKARAKERFFSHRDRHGQWDPRNQRPELWSLYNGRRNPGEHLRVFPLSNWTEMDVWQYVRLEDIPVPSLYLAHQREVVRRNGVLLANTEHLELLESEEVTMKTVRFRTIGDATCTGAFESEAGSVEEVIRETAAVRTTERGGRSDDKRSEAALEDRKRLGYF